MKKLILILSFLLIMQSFSACTSQGQANITGQNEVEEYYIDADKIVEEYLLLLEDLQNLPQESEADSLLALEELSAKSEQLLIKANKIILKNEELQNIHSLLCDTIEQFNMGIKYGYQGITMDSKNLQELSIIELNKSSSSFVDYVNAYAQFNEREN